MAETLLGALIIMFMRMIDVSLGTMRTILVVQGKKYHAAITGFFEVLIWIFAMRYIVQHLDNEMNLIGYAIGFAIGNILGIQLEQQLAIGYVQLNIISRHFTDKITDQLRLSKYGVTLIPAEGGSGGMSIIIAIIKRKEMKNVIKLIETIDPHCFITMQHSRPYRGFIHGARK